MLQVASVLINRSPTVEFPIGRGLRQGDLLSPFLFIIGMEGLHVAIQDAFDSSLFNGLSIGALGTYYMSLFKAPLSVINSIESCHSSFFWGGIAGDRKIHWARWSLILDSKDKGGLGVNSIQSFNLALLYKWRWRYVLDNNFLWVKILQSIHNVQPDGCYPLVKRNVGGVWATIKKTMDDLHKKHILVPTVISRSLGNGCNTTFWTDTWLSDCTFKDKYPRLFSLETDIHCSIASRFCNGHWVWHWRRDLRGGSESVQLENLLYDISNVTLTDAPDKWTCSLDSSQSYVVSHARCLIDTTLLSSMNQSTIWYCLAPSKINIFSWHMRFNRLPMKVSLQDHGIEIPNVSCSLYNQDQDEDIAHIFLHCPIASQVWNCIAQWLGISFPQWRSTEDGRMILALHGNARPSWSLSS